MLYRSISGGSATPTAQADGAAADDVVQAFAGGRGEQFRVGEAGNMAGGVEHDRAGEDGTGQAAASHLVHAGDQAEAVSPVEILDRAPGAGFRHGPGADRRRQACGAVRPSLRTSFMRAALPLRSRR